MKTAHYLGIAAALGLVLLASGCGKFSGYEVDWAPVNIFIRIQDSAGADLLNPENPDNMIDGTSITFRGETYTASRDWYESRTLFSAPQTKAYLARMYGLYLIKDDMLLRDAGDGFSLIFGEIDGAADMDEDIVVSFPDGTGSVIHYHCSDHKEGRKPSCKRKWKLDGAEHNSNMFTFVR